MTHTDLFTAGPLAEPDYPLQCHHCYEDIRPTGSSFEDRVGFTCCAKAISHRPMPNIPRSIR